MPIDVSCKACNAQYKVKDALAGRTAECKHCGHKFMIPYRSAVVKLDEETTETPTAASKPQRTFEEYAPLIEAQQKRSAQRPQEPAMYPLSPVLTDVWLPVGLSILFYGLSLAMSMYYVLQSSGVFAGLLIIFCVACLIGMLVIPVTLKVIESASGSFDFELPNAVYMQTVGSLSLPVFFATLGVLTLGMWGLIAGAIIGAIVCVFAMVVLYQLPAGKGIQSGVLGSLSFLVTSAGSSLALWIFAGLVMPYWGMTRPWDAPSDELIDARAGKTSKPAVVSAAPAAGQTAPVAEAAVAPAAAAPITPVVVASASAAPTTPAGVAPVVPSAPASVAAEANVAAATPAANIFDENFAAGSPQKVVQPVAAAQAGPAAIAAGPSTQPSVPAEAIQVAAVSPEVTEVAAPTTVPVLTASAAELRAAAMQSKWTFQIVKVQQPDLIAMTKQLADEKRELTEAERSATKLRNDANRMESAIEENEGEYVKDRFSGNRRYVPKKKYSERAIGEARAAALRAENNVKKLTQEVAKLERDVEAAKSTRTVIGMLDSGLLVEVTMEGAARMALADSMQPNARWMAEGSATLSQGVIRIKPRVIQPEG